MTYTVPGGALNSTQPNPIVKITHSCIQPRTYTALLIICIYALHWMLFKCTFFSLILCSHCCYNGLPAALDLCPFWQPYSKFLLCHFIV